MTSYTGPPGGKVVEYRMDQNNILQVSISYLIIWLQKNDSRFRGLYQFINMALKPPPLVEASVLEAESEPRDNTYGHRYKAAGRT